MKTLLEDREDRVVDQSPVAPPSAVRGGRRAGDSEVISRKGVIRTYRRYAPVYDWLFGAILQPGRRELAAAVHRFDEVRVITQLLS